MRVVFLVNDLNALGDAQAMLGNAFRRRGWVVCYGLINTISFASPNSVSVMLAEAKEEVACGGKLPGSPQNARIGAADLIWVMNQPHEAIARDCWQLLWMLNQTCKFVNSISSLVFLNNKNNLPLIAPSPSLPETHISNRFDDIWQVYDACREFKWVTKPTNDGCGTNVFLIASDGLNDRAILQSMTGNTVSSAAILADVVTGLKNRYCVLQRYIKDIVEKGEKRIILAAGEAVAQHGRRPAKDEHRSNLTQGGNAAQVSLTSEEASLVSVIGKSLCSYGVNYAGLDLCYPYLLEVNLVNPGGLWDIWKLTGEDFSDAVVNRILVSFESQAASK